MCVNILYVVLTGVLVKYTVYLLDLRLEPLQQFVQEYGWACGDQGLTLLSHTPNSNNGFTIIIMCLTNP